MSMGNKYYVLGREIRRMVGSILKRGNFKHLSSSSGEFRNVEDFLLGEKPCKFSLIPRPPRTRKEKDLKRLVIAKGGGITLQFYGKFREEGGFALDDRFPYSVIGGSKIPREFFENYLFMLEEFSPYIFEKIGDANYFETAQRATDATECCLDLYKEFYLRTRNFL